MGVFILRPKPRPKPGPGGRKPRPVEALEITNYSDDDDGAGGSHRESAVRLMRTDDQPQSAIQLAVRVKREQEVRSLKFHRHFQWADMVPDHRSDAVAAAAEAKVAAGPRHRWRGFLVPANELPRPFSSTFTKFKLRPAPQTAQTLHWIACYEGNNFAGPYVSGCSKLKPHGPQRRKKNDKRRTR